MDFMGGMLTILELKGRFNRFLFWGCLHDILVRYRKAWVSPTWKVPTLAGGLLGSNLGRPAASTGGKEPTPVDDGHPAGGKSEDLGMILHHLVHLYIVIYNI